MTENDREQVAGRGGDGVRFAPSFSVFVLPPHVVCLYSEGRKFFLHGALYCALASAIGTGKGLGEVIGALAADFPAPEIQEAVRRLFDRRFILRATAPGDAAAAYWESLGLLPDSLAENLQEVSVQVQSLGGAGTRELKAALGQLGVRVVDRAAQLIVVLVNDYLDGRLAQFNSDRLTNGQAWLPVQLSGIYSLVGPIFRPGTSACWMCLADRMKWNRPVKAFLDRTDARCVAVSPLGDNILGPSPIGLAAVEIAKAIASAGRTDLHDHLISFDLTGSTIARHYVAARPQCTSCGRSELRDPRRMPIPIRLHVGGTPVVTGKGYRTLTPSATLAHWRKHVSPLTGVVSRLERIGGDLPANATYLAAHNFSPRPETVDALRAGLTKNSFGAGTTAEEAEANALLKGLERVSGIFQSDEIRITRRFVDFAPGEAILPTDITLFSDAQCQQASIRANGADARSDVAHPFDRSAPFEWSPVWSLRDQRFKHLPTGILYYFHRGTGDDRLRAEASGCAAGNTLEEAIVQGFLELVERDACAIWWHNRLRRPAVDLDRFGDSYIDDLRTQFAAAGRQIWTLDITTDLEVPVVVAVCHWRDQSKEHVAFAAGAHFDPRFAALRALTELNQALAVDAMATRPSDRAEHVDPLPLRDHGYLRGRGKAIPRPARLRNFARLGRREQVHACVALAKRHGLDFLILDQTRPDIGVPVVRVIVPGLRHQYRRFAPGRLYDVPVKLGLRKRPLAESQLNLLHPRI
ncbi:MAG TPA: TOMM precursor leader peptide-binding protein [Xanthobacteraceae bacterium]|nr:TOMM precursor leader peptide-binding protein [Xanthobacteraceae bacterium]